MNISTWKRLRTLILILVVALWIYDEVVYFYQGFSNFLYYAAVPTFIIIAGLLLFYIPTKRKMRLRTMELVVSSGNTEEAIDILEKKIEPLRQEAMADASKLPELVKTLVALSVYYRNLNPAKSDNYAKEAIGYLNSPEYPTDKNASEIKKIAEMMISK